jgi:hypothetical protein
MICEEERTEKKREDVQTSGDEMNMNVEREREREKRKLRNSRYIIDK